MIREVGFIICYDPAFNAENERHAHLWGANLLKIGWGDGRPPQGERAYGFNLPYRP